MKVGVAVPRDGIENRRHDDFQSAPCAGQGRNSAWFVARRTEAGSTWVAATRSAPPQRSQLACPSRRLARAPVRVTRLFSSEVARRLARLAGGGQACAGEAGLALRRRTAGAARAARG